MVVVHITSSWHADGIFILKGFRSTRTSETVTTTTTTTTTTTNVCQKNYTLFIFAITFLFVNQFSQSLAVTCLRKFATKRILYFPPHLICVLLLYLVTRAASLTNVHSCRMWVPAHAVSSDILIENPIMNNAVHYTDEWWMVSLWQFDMWFDAFNAPLWLITNSFTVSTFSTVRALWRRPLPVCLAVVPVSLSFFSR